MVVLVVGLGEWFVWCFVLSLWFSMGVVRACFFGGGDCWPIWRSWCCVNVSKLI